MKYYFSLQKQEIEYSYQQEFLVERGKCKDLHAGFNPTWHKPFFGGLDMGPYKKASKGHFWGQIN